MNFQLKSWNTTSCAARMLSAGIAAVRTGRIPILAALQHNSIIVSTVIQQYQATELSDHDSLEHCCLRDWHDKNVSAMQLDN
jgi:hypothetical protein